MWLAGDKDTISATTVADAVAQWSTLLKDIGWDIIFIHFLAYCKEQGLMWFTNRSRYHQRNNRGRCNSTTVLKDIGWDMIIGNGTVLKDIVVWDIIRNIYPLLFFHIFLKGKV